MTATHDKATYLAESNPSKSLVGGRLSEQTGCRSPAALPSPAHQNKLGPGRGLSAVTGSALISATASACLPGDPVRPGPEDPR